MSSIALKLPKNYVEVEREEMEYVDGGWSRAVFNANIIGLNKKYGRYLPSGVWGQVLKGAGAGGASVGYCATVAGFGPEVGAITAAAANLGGVGAGLGVIAGLSGAAGIWYLGNNRKFY